VENKVADQDNNHNHPGEDFIVLGPELPNGAQAVLRHREDHTVEMAELHPIADGQPLPEGAEMVHLLGEGPTYKVESLYKNDDAERKGPSKVTTAKYRSGWDETFGKKDTSSLN